MPESFSAGEVFAIGADETLDKFIMRSNLIGGDLLLCSIDAMEPGANGMAPTQLG